MFVVSFKVLQFVKSLSKLSKEPNKWKVRVDGFLLQKSLRIEQNMEMKAQVPMATDYDNDDDDSE